MDGTISWNKLRAAEKAKVIQLALDNGVSDINTIRDTFNVYSKEFKSGGKIHIDPSKRGTFTAAATKHGKSVQEFARQVLANKENYSPAMVRKAVFAHNSKSWKHSDGGYLIGGIYDVDENEYNRLLSLGYGIEII